MRGPGWPVARAGMRIGLLGGSFDPAHTGHVHVSRAALTGFGLDRVWWLVSPGNPLKPDAPAPLERRLARARAIMQAPRVEVTALEARMATRYTADTLRGLRRRYPGVRFVWLMGADNLAGFHHWDEWRRIFAMTPLGVIARPGQRISANMSMAARAFDSARVPPHASRRLGMAHPPAWCFINIPMREESSTELRRRGDWER